MVGGQAATPLWPHPPTQPMAMPRTQRLRGRPAACGTFRRQRLEAQSHRGQRPLWQEQPLTVCRVYCVPGSWGKKWLCHHPGRGSQVICAIYSQRTERQRAESARWAPPAPNQNPQPSIRLGCGGTRLLSRIYISFLGTGKDSFRPLQRCFGGWWLEAGLSRSCEFSLCCLVQPMKALG